MFLVQVIPFTKIGKEELTYFTSTKLDIGSIVQVPIKKRVVPALVVRCQVASESKSALRQADYEVKKINTTSTQSFFLPEFIEAARDTALYFATNTGGVIRQLTAARVFDRTPSIIPLPILAKTNRMHDLLMVQADDEERFANYKSLIREEFAKKSSVFFCLPSIQEIAAAQKKLEKGIEKYTFVLHGSLSLKKSREVYEKILEETHPVLIIATGNYLHMPRKDIGAYIAEKENSKSYKTLSRPYIDIRDAIRFLSKRMNAKAVFGDLFLSTETVYRYKMHEFQELSPLKFRSLSTAETTLVDMRAHKATAKTFRVISPELENVLLAARENGQRTFIFASRKGLAPSTVCGDCGNIVLCKNCGASVILHAGKSNFFLCHRCGERRSAEEVCVTCGSWKLIPLGIGTEKVVESVRKILPAVHVVALDKDSVRTHKQALQARDEFYSLPGAVMVGTEMALPYLDREIDNVAIASIDSFFGIPDYRMSEKIMSVLLRLRSLASRTLVLQTRKPEEKLFEYALKGNLMEFYRDEIELRKQFLFPPFSVLIKISIEGNKDKVVEEMSRVKSLFGSYEFDIFPTFIRGQNGKSIIHGLIKIPKSEWPKQDVVDILMSLPPSIIVKIDPDSLL